MLIYLSVRSHPAANPPQPSDDEADCQFDLCFIFLFILLPLIHLTEEQLYCRRELLSGARRRLVMLSCVLPLPPSTPLP